MPIRMKLLSAGLLFVCMVVLPAIGPPATSAAEKRPSIGLALGSGGATGLAHIKMLQVFDDLGIKPDRITGTSIGALIGGLYAAGLQADQIQKIFNQFGGSELDALRNWNAFVDLDIGNGALLDSSGFLGFLSEKISARIFKELAIPLEVIATDYWTGEMVVLESGDLFSAIEASIAVPGLFSPVVRDERLLIDGGTSNPLPFDRLIGRYDITVAIDVSGYRKKSDKNQIGWHELLFSTFEIMQQSIIAEKLQRQHPRIYIKPDIHDIRMLHFNRIESILKDADTAAGELKKQLATIIKASP